MEGPVLNVYSPPRSLAQQKREQTTKGTKKSLLCLLCTCPDLLCKAPPRRGGEHAHIRTRSERQNETAARSGTFAVDRTGWKESTAFGRRQSLRFHSPRLYSCSLSKSCPS